MTPSPYRQPGRSLPSEPAAPARPPIVAVFAMIMAVAIVVVLNRAAERDREKHSGGVVVHVTIVDVMLDSDRR